MYGENLLQQVAVKQPLQKAFIVFYDGSIIRDSNTGSNIKKEFKRYFLGDDLPGVYLTKREAECVYHLVLGKRRRTIAAAVGLSMRTVETYIANVKKKLGCRTKLQLIAIISASDFMKNLDFFK